MATTDLSHELEIVRAINLKRTDNVDIKSAFELYSMAQIGFALTLEDVPAIQADMIQIIHKEVMRGKPTIPNGNRI